MHGQHSVFDIGHDTVIHCCAGGGGGSRWLTNEKKRKTDDSSNQNYRALNKNWSYQPTLAGRAMSQS